METTGGLPLLLLGCIFLLRCCLAASLDRPLPVQQPQLIDSTCSGGGPRLLYVNTELRVVMKFQSPPAELTGQQSTGGG